MPSASIPHRDTGAQSSSNGNSTSSPARVEKESHRGEANAHNKKVVRQETCAFASQPRSAS